MVKDAWACLCTVHELEKGCLVVLNSKAFVTPLPRGPGHARRLTTWMNPC